MSTSQSETRKSNAGEPGKQQAAATTAAVTIRHYCQGIGDCHLLRFARNDGTPFFMLIDCGVHSAVAGGSELMRRIVADIAAVTSHIDVLVVTDEHWDHVSGFLTAAEQFKAISVGEVWMAWTENPHDAQARARDKFKGDAVAALQAASRSLDRDRGLSEHMSDIRDGLHALLGFQFGAQGERARAAGDAAAAMAGDRGVSYLEPAHDPIALDGVDDVRIYVLGPPRDNAMLGVANSTSETYGAAGAATWPMAAALQGALGAGDAGKDDGAPFDFNLGTSLSALLSAAPEQGAEPREAKLRAFLQDHYAGPAAVETEKSSRTRKRKPDPNETDQSWRRIDTDWLGVSADLALQLDRRTNDASLVLAFEFIDSGRVMLFAADAQVGNWLSWQDVQWGEGKDAVTGPDLLARTVYYKVGHHGSENATPKAKGLELMNSPDLSAFIPTSQADAKNVGWGKLPFEPILRELERRADGRVIRADDAWLGKESGKGAFPLPSGSLRDVRHEPGLWVEVDVV